MSDQAVDLKFPLFDDEKNQILTFHLRLITKHLLLFSLTWPIKAPLPPPRLETMLTMRRKMVWTTKLWVSTGCNSWWSSAKVSKKAEKLQRFCPICCVSITFLRKMFGQKLLGFNQFSDLFFFCSSKRWRNVSHFLCDPWRSIVVDLTQKGESDFLVYECGERKESA